MVFLLQGAAHSQYERKNIAVSRARGVHKGFKGKQFFSTKEVEINGIEISPLDFTSKILMNEWKLNPSEKEFTVMRIGLKGENSEGKPEELVYNLYDETSSLFYLF